MVTRSVVAALGLMASGSSFAMASTKAGLNAANADVLKDLFQSDALPCHSAGVAACVNELQVQFFECPPTNLECQCGSLRQLELSCYGICPESDILLYISETINDVCSNVGPLDSAEHEPPYAKEETESEEQNFYEDDAEADADEADEADEASVEDADAEAADVEDDEDVEDAEVEDAEVEDAEEPAEEMTADEDVDEADFVKPAEIPMITAAPQPQAAADGLFEVSVDTTFGPAASEEVAGVTSAAAEPTAAPEAAEVAPEQVVPAPTPAAAPAQDAPEAVATPEAVLSEDDFPEAYEVEERPSPVAIFTPAQTVFYDAEATMTVTYPQFLGYDFAQATPAPEAAAAEPVVEAAAEPAAVPEASAEHVAAEPMDVSQVADVPGMMAAAPTAAAASNKTQKADAPVPKRNTTLASPPYANASSSTGSRVNSTGNYTARANETIADSSAQATVVGLARQILPAASIGLLVAFLAF
ncbi:uncharacterized protein V1510DRAFT_417487 [Dipodascopsis tothii]|uniref:uncharacterized protein n=1 Tax=Dipodascopsis tothii TaxID=44089 RepID=UPI0034CDE8FF